MVMITSHVVVYVVAHPAYGDVWCNRRVWCSRCAWAWFIHWSGWDLEVGIFLLLFLLFLLKVLKSVDTLPVIGLPAATHLL